MCKRCAKSLGTTCKRFHSVVLKIIWNDVRLSPPSSKHRHDHYTTSIIQLFLSGWSRFSTFSSLTIKACITFEWLAIRIHTSIPVLFGTSNSNKEDLTLSRITPSLLISLGLHNKALWFITSLKHCRSCYSFPSLGQNY